MVLECHSQVSHKFLLSFLFSQKIHWMEPTVVLATAGPPFALAGWKNPQEKLCEILPSLECEVCENATSLQKYRDCVGSKIMTYQNSKKQKDKEIEASYQLDETIQNQKRMLGWNHDAINKYIYIFYKSPAFFFLEKGRGHSYTEKWPSPPTHQVETHETKCLNGSPWCLSDVGHTSKLGALDFRSHMAVGGFERRREGNEGEDEPGSWQDPYIYINGCFNWMIPNVCLIKDPFKTACLEFQEDDC